MYSLNETFEHEIEPVKLSEAIATSRISGALFGPIPPGAIILDFGERVKEDHRKYFDGDPDIYCIIETTKRTSFKNKKLNILKP